MRNAKWRRGVLARKAEAKTLQKQQILMQQAQQVLSQRRWRNSSSCNDSSEEDGPAVDQLEMESTINVEVQSAVVDISSSDSDALEEQDFEPDVELSLTEKLRLWVNENRVSQTATNRLLKLLVQYHPELPRHQRTLLRTATDIDVDKVAGGDFSYLSLRRVLPAVLKKARVTALRLHDSNNEVKIQFNVDGVPVFNSVNYSMWPILGAVVSPFKSKVFTVAVYGGSSKPDDFNKYMQPLV
ncbi:MAG: hypothetical protein IT514_15670, partial [Burkholderiales bacterium]|nr:hypothetical protein [Burkholderiales bacterium]